MEDTVITDVGEVVNEDIDVEIFDDDNREEEERQYLQDIDYDSVVISEKIKERKKLLKQKFDDLKKLNKDKKNHSKEILLLNEIIDIALEKIKYEIVDCRIKGIKGTILILKANISILNFFKNFLDEKSEKSEDIGEIISNVDNLFLKEFISPSKSKNYLEYQDVIFDHDEITTLYHEDKYVLVKILEKQARELLDTILHLENIDKNENNLSDLVDMKNSANDIIKKLYENSIKHAPKEGAEQLTMEEEGTDVEDDAAMEEEGTDVEDEELVMQKILGILQDFIYTECIDVIKPSLADSIIALKLSSIKKDIELSSIKKDIELSKSKQCPSIEKSPQTSRSPSSPGTQPPQSPQSPQSPPAGTGGGRKKKSKKGEILKFKF